MMEMSKTLKLAADIIEEKGYIFRLIKEGEIFSDNNAMSPIIAIGMPSSCRIDKLPSMWSIKRKRVGEIYKELNAMPNPYGEGWVRYYIINFRLSFSKDRIKTVSEIDTIIDKRYMSLYQWAIKTLPNITEI